MPLEVATDEALLETELELLELAVEDTGELDDGVTVELLVPELDVEGLTLLELVGDTTLLATLEEPDELV